MNSDPVAKPLTAIVAIDRRGAIGCKNHLPWAIKSDMAFFRRTTMGNVVVMGRRTYDSIGGCLKGRDNVILSRRAPLFHSTETCKFVPALSDAVAAIESSSAIEAFVIGGAYTYEEFRGLVDRYIVTFVDHEAEDADAFLSKSIIDEFTSWEVEELGAFPEVKGQDQYAFRIAAFTAPDAKDRATFRAGIAARAPRNAANRRQNLAKHGRLCGHSAPSALLT